MDDVTRCWGSDVTIWRVGNWWWRCEEDASMLKGILSVDPSLRVWEVNRNLHMKKVDINHFKTLLNPPVSPPNSTSLVVWCDVNVQTSLRCIKFSHRRVSLSNHSGASRIESNDTHTCDHPTRHKNLTAQYHLHHYSIIAHKDADCPFRQWGLLAV